MGMIISLALLLALAGCQAAVTEQPIPTPEIIAEGEAECQLQMTSESYSFPSSIETYDPISGVVQRGIINTFTVNCENPYLIYTCIDVQDHKYKGDLVQSFTSINECVTDEGGVWKGTCTVTIGEHSVCTSLGDGIYTDLSLETDADLVTMIMKYKVSRLAAK